MPFVQRVVEPKFLSRTSLFDADGKPRVTDDELEAVTNNTLSNALRQLASLALAANNIFVELTKQLQNVTQRSDLLKGKIGALEQKVSSFDPKKVAVPVSDICTFALLKEHYKAQHDLATNLFNASTRPSAVQALYEAAAKTPIPLMRQMDRWRRDGHRSSRFFVCTPVLGARRRKIRSKVDIDIETRMPAAVEELRRWTSAEALGDITVAPDCPNRIVPNVTFSDGNVTDGTIASDDEAIDHKLPSPEEQVQVIALKFPAEMVAVDVSGRAFNRMSVQRRSLLHGEISYRQEDSGTSRRHTRVRKPRSRRRNTLAGTDQKEIQNAITSGEMSTTITNDEHESPESGAVFRSKSSEPLRATPKKDSSIDSKKSHFYTLKQWGKNRLKMINRSSEASKSTAENSNKSKDEDQDLNIYETVTIRRRRSLNRDKRMSHERKHSYSSSEKSSINLPISTPLSAAMNIAVKLRESSTQRRLRRSGGNKDEPHSSSGNWSASSESGRASIGSEITSTTQPKSSTSTATSSNSLNQHPPSSVNSRRKFNTNTSGSSSLTSEGTLTPDIHDLHEDGETSSVYSCDTEGYYTSFHVDSGLKTLKEEDMPATPLHSTTAFSNSSSSNTVLTAENEYELFGKGSTSTTASSAGTVCTALKATGSSRSLSVGPAVPERKSSLSKSSTKDKSPGSSLEREFGSERTGTVKRSPASSKTTVVAVVHQQTDGDVSPDSGHNTSSSPIESANSPNGVRSGSEFEFSECSDMEGPDRIERIRVKTTINSSRIPSMCVITPPHSDDESVKSHNNYEHFNNKKNVLEERNLNNRIRKDLNRSKLGLPLKPMETDLDNLEFADSESEDVAKTRPIKTSLNGTSKMQLINVNPQSGYATIETIDTVDSVKTDANENQIPKTNSSVRAPSPSGGSVTIKEETIKPQTQPIFKATLLPFNNVLGKLKSNFTNFSKKENKTCWKECDNIGDIYDDAGDYVTIADVRNNNEKVPMRSEKIVSATNTKASRETEYVSLNELPCNAPEDTLNANVDSLERKRRQGARVTLDAEGKVVYTSDSLRRRKGAHTTFEPGPYVKETTTPSASPLPSHRIPKPVRPINNTQEQRLIPLNNDSRPLSPQMGKVVIRAASGMCSPTAEIVRVPPSTIVTPTIRPISPKPINSRGAYVHVQDTRGSLPTANEKEPVYSPSDQPNACKNWAMENPVRRPLDFTDPYGYQNPLIEANLQSIDRIHNEMYSRGNPAYRTLPSRKSQCMVDNYNYERPITPDIMRGLPSNQFNTSTFSSPGSYRRFKEMKNISELPARQYPVQQIGIPVQLPEVTNLTSKYRPQVPSVSHFQNPTSSYLQSTSFHSSTPTKIEPRYYLQQTETRNLSPVSSNVNLQQSSDTPNDSLKISPIDPRNIGGFQSSTPSSKLQELKAAANLESKLLSPKKSTMSTEELYAVIHKGKKKLNIHAADTSTEPAIATNTQSPNRCMSPETRVKSPETGYIGEKARSRFSWSPSDGEYVEYNTNIDKLSPSPEAAGSRQSWACSDRKGNQQTSRLDFKKLLLQQSAKSNVASPGIKKLSAVEQLKLSKQHAQSGKPSQSQINILELSGSPRNLQNRKLTTNTPGSPKNGPEKQRPMPKLLSPRSQWRFANPRSDVLSSTIPEDCGEDENSSNLIQQKYGPPISRKQDVHSDSKFGINSTGIPKGDCLTSGILKSKQNLPSTSVSCNNNEPKPLVTSSTTSKSSTSISQYLKAQRANFFSSTSSTQKNSQSSPSMPKNNSKENKTCIPPPTLETAF
ncbi:hypothetical protein ILUMI_23930 [Ignelater luminosus]|uniref:WASP family protein member n=1 Tax=Ignelater luminosus TaxID=2038154 RepID=A0A8K0FZ78_IGNLU|nr:hypothetical protein ILUMI_23930 [Ignelater luminosus]